MPLQGVGEVIGGGRWRLGREMAAGASAVASSEHDGLSGGWLCCQGVALVNDNDAAVKSFLDFHSSASVAGPVVIGEYLAGGAVEPDGVVVGHGADVLEG